MLEELHKLSFETKKGLTTAVAVLMTANAFYVSDFFRATDAWGFMTILFLAYIVNFLILLATTFLVTFTYQFFWGEEPDANSSAFANRNIINANLVIIVASALFTISPLIGSAT